MSPAEVTSVQLELPPSLVEAVAVRAAELVREGEPLTTERDPWVGVEQAAAHLACPKSRIYALASCKPARIPVMRDGTRLLFRRSELDAWLADGGGKRP